MHGVREKVQDTEAFEAAFSYPQPEWQAAQVRALQLRECEQMRLARAYRHGAPWQIEISVHSLRQRYQEQKFA